LKEGWVRVSLVGIHAGKTLFNLNSFIVPREALTLTMEAGFGVVEEGASADGNV
jgi:hypothetical protein